MLSERRMYDTLLSIAALLGAGGAVWWARDWPLGGRIFPTTVGALIVVLAAARTVWLLREEREERLADPGAAPGSDRRVRFKAPVRDSLTCCAALAVGSAFLFGFLIAIPLTTLAHSLMSSPSQWKNSLAASVFMLLIALATTRLLGVPLPDGRLL